MTRVRNAAALSLLGLALAAIAPAEPRTDRPGPWDNDVLVHRVGADGRQQQLWTFSRAGVPSVARLTDGRLIAAFQHFPADDQRNFDRVAVSFSKDEGGTWSTPEPIAVNGLSAGLARPFDPTLVPLPDGRVRLYFTSNNSPDFRRSVPRIYSAVSRDGVTYEFEPGIRFAVEGRVVIDCAVALHDRLFHLYVPDNGTPEEMQRGMARGEPAPGGRGYHATSADGLTFERRADVTYAGGKWLGCAVGDGRRLLFFGTGRGPWPLESADGATWKPASPTLRVPGADPGAVRLKDGSWLMIVTGPPRPGTPSARRGPGGG